MSDKEKKPKNELKDGEVIYPSSKSSITTIKSNNTTTFSNTETGKINYKNEIKSYPKFQNIPNISVQGSSFTSSGRNNNTSSSTNSQKNQKLELINFGFQNNEFEKFKNLESILETKAKDIEKGLLSKQSTVLKSLNTSLDNALKDIDKHKIETREELKETRNSVLGTIALFAAFFTFVSVNVNIFTKAENVIQSIIFMLSFWLCIIGFISLFFLFLNKSKDTSIYKTVEFGTTVGCILLSCILMYLLFNKSDSESYEKINIKLEKIKSENDSLKKENSSLNKKINNDLELINEQIIELRKNQYQLNQQ